MHAPANDLSAPRPWSEHVATGKDLVALLRDLVIFLVGVALIAFPKALNDRLVSAGFEEGSVVGFRWKAKLVESDVALRDANQTITALRQQSDTLLAALVAARAQLSDTALRARIGQLEQESHAASGAAESVQAAVRQTIVTNAPLVEQAQNGVSGEWLVVFGGDPTLQGAAYEVDLARRRLGVPHAQVFLRQGAYRAVAVAGDRAEAGALLARVRPRRRDAYVVRRASWCGAVVERAGYSECPAP